MRHASVDFDSPSSSFSFVPGQWRLRTLGLASIVALLVATLLAGCTPAASVSAKTDPRVETVVLLHGLGRSPRAMSQLGDRLEAAGYRVERLGYSSLGETPQTILADVKQQIDACCTGGSAPVHFVGHSLGGLLIRAYLDDERPDNLGRVVLLGTPNHGTAVVDEYRDSWWFSLLGPMALALGTDANSFPNSLPAPDYPVGVVAGRKPHRQSEALTGANDGLVSVDSTRVDGMSDFIVIDVGHAAMRHDARVADQTISFLKQGRFKRG